MKKTSLSAGMFHLPAVMFFLGEYKDFKTTRL